MTDVKLKELLKRRTVKLRDTILEAIGSFESDTGITVYGIEYQPFTREQGESPIDIKLNVDF